MIRAGVLVLASALPASADAVAWMGEGQPPGSVLHKLGEWQATDGALWAIDPLTLYGADGAPFDVPKGPASLVSWSWPQEGRVTAMALVWGSDPVVCDDMAAVIGVDTGLAALIDADGLAAVKAFSAAHDDDPYQGTYAEQLDALDLLPALIALDDADFPVSRSGWGDGGYPVSRLRDANGAVQALYVQYIPGSGDWQTLPACG